MTSPSDSRRSTWSRCSKLQQAEHAYDASRAAAEERLRLMAERPSFITETVFSHPSKVDLLAQVSALE
jgi:predicted ABC-type ATPase